MERDDEYLQAAADAEANDHAREQEEWKHEENDFHYKIQVVGRSTFCVCRDGIHLDTMVKDALKHDWVVNIQVIKGKM